MVVESHVSSCCVHYCQIEVCTFITHQTHHDLCIICSFEVLGEYEHPIKCLLQLGVGGYYHLLAFVGGLCELRHDEVRELHIIFCTITELLLVRPHAHKI